MNKPLDPNVVLLEGGILPQVLPNPQSFEDYVKLLSAPPIPIEKFYATKEMIDFAAADKEVRLIPNSTASVSQSAQSLFADEVKNATLETMSKGRITSR